jgi:hypothetical protein
MFEVGKTIFTSNVNIIDIVIIDRTIFSEKKLDESSLETLYDIIRTNSTWNIYNNEHIIDAILRRLTVVCVHV